MNDSEEHRFFSTSLKLVPNGEILPNPRIIASELSFTYTLSKRGNINIDFKKAAK